MQEINRAYRTPRDMRSKIRMWLDGEHICVLTIGKTASSAIIMAFIEAGVPAYQAHTLSRSPQEYLFVAGLKPKPLQNMAFKLKTAAWLRLTRNTPKRFVTTFRDPFARNMSAFFEQSWKLGRQIENTGQTGSIGQVGNIGQVEDMNRVEDMETDALAALYETHGPHDVTRTWFADNLARPFGLSARDLDLRSHPAQELGAGKRRFLMLKYEDQSGWETALSRFAGAPVSLERRNESTRKSYSDALARLKSVWRPSPAIVARSLDRDLWDALYTDAEKTAIRTRWEIPRALAP
ncbi:MAG: putative capsular polysaccharide synthesis family protein [Pseudomonadota bacterium]